MVLEKLDNIDNVEGCGLTIVAYKNSESRLIYARETTVLHCKLHWLDDMNYWF